MSGHQRVTRQPRGPEHGVRETDSTTRRRNAVINRGTIARGAAVLTSLVLLGTFPLAAQETARQETRPDEYFRYTISADGISLEQLVKDAEANTGKTFVYSDAAAAGVKNKTVKMLGTAVVHRSQVFSLFQGILISQNLAMTPLGDEKNGIFLIETVDQPQNRLKQRAPFVHESNLAQYRHEIGTVIMTSIQLKHIKVDNVRNAIQQILTNRNVEFTMDVVSANSLIVVGFAPSVYALAQVIAAMDVPQIEATLKFELIHLAHAVADELVPIIENLIKGDAAQPQRARPPTPEGGVFGGAEKPEPKIIADPRTNSLVVYAVESDMNKIKYLVSALDTEVKEPESNIRIYFLKNTNADDLVDVLKEVLSGGSTAGRGSRPGSIRGATGQQPVSTTTQSGQDLNIVSDPNNNALLITASKTRYAEILPIIQELDRRRPQVLVQAAIAELSDSDARDIGVEIAAFQGGNNRYRAAGVTGFGLSTITTTGEGEDTNIIRIPFLTPGAGSTATSISPSGGVFGIFNNELNVPFFVALLQRTTKSNLVSMPSVLTNDNEQSTITFSKSVATQTFQTTVAGTDNTGFGGYQEAKIELIISPHISNDNYVRMEVELTVEAFLGTQISPTIPPDKTTRKLVGSVTVRSGKTVVIGGLIQENETNRISQVPYLGDIPMLGELFKRTEKLKEKDTLYVFITPTIFTGFEELEEVSYEKKLEIWKLDGQIRIIDPNFRPIQLDDRRVRIECIEELGTLDIPRYAPVVPCGECGAEAQVPEVDGVPVRPQTDPNGSFTDAAPAPRPASRRTSR
jgi:general secretion pathway protein D